MQKWQYCVVTSTNKVKGDEEHEPRPEEITVGKWTLPAEKISVPEEGSLRRVLNDLGDEGWEVAGMGMSPFADMLIILKRPKETG